MTQRTQNSSYIGQCECAVRHSFLTQKKSYRAGALLRRSHTYWGAQPIWTLNINTAVLNTNCSCSGRMSNFLSFAVTDREWSGNISFAARLWKELSFFQWTSLALTLFLRSGACFSTTGRKASYQADNALVGSETLNAAANGAEFKSWTKLKKVTLIKMFKRTILNSCVCCGIRKQKLSLHYV